MVVHEREHYLWEDSELLLLSSQAQHIILSKQPVTRSILTFQMRKGLVRDMGGEGILASTSYSGNLSAPW